MTKNKRKRNVFAKYSSVIATVATAILAVTALITVYISISAWSEEREANRPYFTFKESPQVVFNESLEFEIIFTNVGEHPAVSLWSKSIVFTSDLKAKPIVVEEYALVNDIPKNASATLLIGLNGLEEQAKEGKIQPHFIVIALRYKDPIINEDFEQTLYIKWNGIEKGKLLLTNHAEQNEKEQILKYFDQNNIDFNKN